MDQGLVSSEIINGIGTITFGHPQSNSLPGEILNKLASEIIHLGSQRDVKVIVLKSVGEKNVLCWCKFR